MKEVRSQVYFVTGSPRTVKHRDKEMNAIASAFVAEKLSLNDQPVLKLLFVRKSKCALRAAL